MWSGAASAAAVATTSEDAASSAVTDTAPGSHVLTKRVTAPDDTASSIVTAKVGVKK
jgi:hypothetical protein